MFMWASIAWGSKRLYEKLLRDIRFSLKKNTLAQNTFSELIRLHFSEEKDHLALQQIQDIARHAHLSDTAAYIIEQKKSHYPRTMRAQDYFDLAKALYDSKKYQKAKEELQKFIENFPNDEQAVPAAHFYIGCCPGPPPVVPAPDGHPRTRRLRTWFPR